MRLSKISIRYFPFSPGIPWKVKNGRYILPELGSAAWKRATDEREIVVVAYGGLLETIVSLSYLEMMNHQYPGNRLHWVGDQRFLFLAQAQGLASLGSYKITPQLLLDYPVPLFFDRKNGTYFNCLLNYRRVKTYYGEYRYRDKSSAVKQIFRNSMQSWSPSYVPRMRKESIPIELTQWAKSSRFYFNQPYVCVVMDDTSFSIHTQTALKWTDKQLVAFAQVLRQKGIATVAFTKTPGRYYNSPVLALPLRLDFIMQMLPEAKAVLSKNPDFLIVAGMISKAKIIAEPLRHELNLQKNKKFLGSENDIYTAKRLSPVAVATLIGE